MATRDWKSESVTNLLTNLLTWVGARDTCVSKNAFWKNTLNKKNAIRKYSLENYNLYLTSPLSHVITGTSQNLDPSAQIQTNSGPFWHFRPDPDYVWNSKLFWSHWMSDE